MCNKLPKKNEVLKLELQVDAVPKSFKPRTMPYAYEDKVQKELECMVEEGIIVEETAPTD